MTPDETFAEFACTMARAGRAFDTIPERVEATCREFRETMDCYRRK